MNPRVKSLLLAITVIIACGLSFAFGRASRHETRKDPNPAQKIILPSIIALHIAADEGSVTIEDFNRLCFDLKKNFQVHSNTLPTVDLRRYEYVCNSINNVHDCLSFLSKGLRYVKTNDIPNVYFNLPVNLQKQSIDQIAEHSFDVKVAFKYHLASLDDYLDEWIDAWSNPASSP